LLGVVVGVLVVIVDVAMLVCFKTFLVMVVMLNVTGTF